MKVWWTVIEVVLAIALLVTGCSGSAASNPFLGKTAPDFKGFTLGGNIVSLIELRGRPVILNFWAVRCQPCRAEMPLLQQIYDEYRAAGLVLLAVNNGENVDTVSLFISENRLTLPVVMDFNGEIADRYGVYGLPTTYFIDRNGTIRDIAIGGFIAKTDITTRLKKIT